MEHDLTISTLREMQQSMPKSTPFERLVLLAVACDDKPMKMSVVARWVGITQGALTTVVDRLASAGLVQRIQNPDDRRISLVQLTRKGAKVIAGAEKRATEIAA